MMNITQEILNNNFNGHNILDVHDACIKVIDHTDSYALEKMGFDGFRTFRAASQLKDMVRAKAKQLQFPSK